MLRFALNHFWRASDVPQLFLSRGAFADHVESRKPGIFSITIAMKRRRENPTVATQLNVVATKEIPATAFVGELVESFREVLG